MDGTLQRFETIDEVDALTACGPVAEVNPHPVTRVRERQRVWPRLSIHLIISTTSLDEVDPVPTFQHVISDPAAEDIDAAHPEDRIVPVEPRYDVVP
jgi:hypothetical protein